MSGKRETSRQPLELLDEQELAAYLRKNPDFFQRYPDLSAAPRRQAGDSAWESSLLQQQSRRKFASPDSMALHMDELFAVAQRNSELFAQVRKFVLAVMDARHINEVLQAVLRDLEQNFRIPVSRILLFRAPPALQHYENVVVMPPQQAQQKIGHILDSRQPTCGLLRDEERDFLFAEQAPRVSSAAIIPLVDGAGALGLLALGNGDADHYQSGVGDMFIGYMGEVLQRVLTHHLRDAD